MEIIITVGYYKSQVVRVLPDELIRYVELLEQAFPGEWGISGAPLDYREPDGEPDFELPVEEAAD